MTPILLVGCDPETEDLSDSAPPSELNAEKTQAGIQLRWSRCKIEVGRTIVVSYGLMKRFFQLLRHRCRRDLEGAVSPRSRIEGSSGSRWRPTHG
jgi:hypothetical protein